MKGLKKVKEELVGQVASVTYLENYMYNKGQYKLVDETDEVLKFYNGSDNIWYDIESDGREVLVVNIKQVTKKKGVSTEVDPFHNFEDMKNVLDDLYNKGLTHHWITGWMMVMFGRRVGDTVALRWCDLMDSKGNWKERLNTLEEDKTEKVVGVRNNKCIIEFLEKYIELKCINPLSADKYYNPVVDTGEKAFSTALKKSAIKCGITYPVGSHSFRKFYGNTNYKLHPQDADALTIVQSMFGHSSPEITKGYIGMIGEKIDKYNKDYADYIIKMNNGEAYEINNNPVITLTNQDLRTLLQQAYELGNSHSDKTESILSLIDEAENKRVI